MGNLTCGYYKKPPLGIDSKVNLADPEMRKAVSKQIRKNFSDERLFVRNRPSATCTQSFVSLNSILPKLPPCFEFGLSNVREFRTPVFVVVDENNLSEIDRFVKKGFKDIFSLFHNYIFCRGYLARLEAVIFLKMVYFVHDEILNDIVTWKRFPKLLHDMLMSHVDDTARVAVKIFAVINDRLPDKAHEFLSIGDCLSRLKYWLVNYTKKESEDYFLFHLRGKIELIDSTIPAHNIISKAVSNSDKSLNREALQDICDYLDIDSERVDEFIYSSVVPILECFLSPLQDDDIKEKNFKTFFEVFLRKDSNGKLDAFYFRKLVQKSLSTVDYLYDEILAYDLEEEEEFNESSYLVDRLRTAKVITTLINYLFILNTVWNHWIDIPSDRKELLDKNEFHSKNILSLVRNNSSYYRNPKLITDCPFLIPFDERRDIFYKLLKEQKHICDFYCESRNEFTLSRDDVLKDLHKLFNGNSCQHAKLHFTFRDEIGFGDGVTKEAFRVISQEFQSKDLDLWFGDVREGDAQKSYLFSPNGLYPKPGLLENDAKALQHFNLFGNIVAKALFDKTLLNISLNKSFYWSLNKTFNNCRNGYVDVANILPMLSNFIPQLIKVKEQKDIIQSDHLLTEKEKFLKVNELTVDGCTFENMMIIFTLPGNPEIELIEDGKNVSLSPHNIDLYLDSLSACVLHKYSNSRLDSFKQGFKTLMGKTHDLFSPDEMELLLVGEFKEEWTEEYLKEHLTFDSTRTKCSKSVKYLCQALSSFTSKEQSLFLEFVTSTTRLPQGGLASLQPAIEIRQFRWSDSIKDVYLPSSSTCFNILYLPQYSNCEILKQKLLQAIQEGKNSFHLV